MHTAQHVSYHAMQMNANTWLSASRLAAQADRERVLEEFRCAKLPLLIATDVAGRGLHISGLEHVVRPRKGTDGMGQAPG